jgi:hypothetical protein
MFFQTVPVAGAGRSFLKASYFHMRWFSSFGLAFVMLVATLGTHVFAMKLVQPEQVFVQTDAFVSPWAQDIEDVMLWPTSSVDVLEHFEELEEDRGEWTAEWLAIPGSNNSAQLFTVDDRHELFGPPPALAVNFNAVSSPPLASVVASRSPWPRTQLRPPIRA